MNILQECSGAKRIGISGHIRPDGDCVCSCLALCSFLRKQIPSASVTVFLENPPDIFQNLVGFEDISSDFDVQESMDVFFVLDCSEDRLGGAQPIYEKAAKKINIDHHISNKGCGDVSLVVSDASATAEVLYDLLEQGMDAEIAEALYVGIIHDCGVFQYSNTSPKTMEIGAKLIRFGFNFPKIIEETFYQKTYLQTQIMGRALMESIRFMDGACIVSCVDKKEMEFYNVTSKDMDGIVNQLRNIKGIHCAIFMYQIDVLEYKVSMRSDELVNVAEVASYFGGGGHMRAAGCTMKGTFHDCVNNLSFHIEKQLKDNKNV